MKIRMRSTPLQKEKVIESCKLRQGQACLWGAVHPTPFSSGDPFEPNQSDGQSDGYAR